jgi:hypothetical protein
MFVLLLGAAGLGGPATATAPATQPASAPASQPVLRRELILKLDDAFSMKYDWGKKEAFCDVILGVPGYDEAWGKDVWGQNTLISRYLRQGVLADVKQTGDDLHMVILIDIRDNANNPGNPARYAVDLKRRGQSYEGAYVGTIKGREYRGRASGTFKSLPTRIDGHVPVEPGEHPRLLFRKGDIAGLRRKARTPQGKAILARLEQVLRESSADTPRGYYAAGHGLLYVLTGDKRHADMAAQIAEGIDEIVIEDLRDSDNLDADAASALGLALAYDFCYDAWDPVFRCGVADQLDRTSAILSRFGTVRDPTGFTWGRRQGYARSVVGTICLAILEDVGLYGPRGSPPMQREMDPPRDFQPGRGVPVMKFASDKVPTQWLVAGPFCLPEDDAYGPGKDKREIDFLSSLGGPEKARPAEGTQVRFKDAALEFHPADLAQIAARKNRPLDDGIYASNLVHSVFNSVTYYYSVVDNDKPRLVRAMLDATRCRPSMWIAGKPVGRGDFIKLAPGRYPVLLRVSLGANPGPWDWIVIKPRFVEMTENQWNQEFQRVSLEWKNTHSGREGTGRRFDAPSRLQDAAQSVRRFLVLGVGEHGWDEEGDAALGEVFTDGVFPFVQSYRSAMGIDLASGSGADWVLPLCSMRLIKAKGRPCHPAYGPVESASMPRPGLFPMGLGTVPKEQLPAVLWTYEDLWGDRGDKTFAIGSPLEGIFAFVNVPVAMEPRNPGQLLPKAVQDEQTGYCVFRAGWKDEADFVATVSLNSLDLARSATEAGAFRIWGLGERWAVQRRAGVRAFDNVMQGPTDDSRAQARCTQFEARPDGSGVVSMALKETYIAKRGYNKEPIGPPIAAVRSFAADYSGACGAPGLFAVVDKRPAGRNTWQMCATMGYEVSAAGQEFTIQSPSGASMKGTVVAPAGAQVAYYPADARITAVGNGDFYVVMTVQKGAAPSVKLTGEGLGAKAQVGDRSVSFDGEKIVLDGK